MNQQIVKILLLAFIWHAYSSRITAKIDSSCTEVNHSKFKREYTRYGKNKIPKIFVSGVEKKYYAVILYDKNPVARNWVHWIEYDIPKETTKINGNIRAKCILFLILQFYFHKFTNFWMFSLN